jgi:hypothetical protein
MPSDQTFVSNHGSTGLDELDPEPERLEDVLTSAVCGSLAWTRSIPIMREWLRIGGGDDEPFLYWFWPRLHGVEPDVLLRIGATLVAVEAKLDSGLHDKEMEEDDPPGNQLYQQHLALTTRRQERRRYPEDLESALVECEIVQAYVVDARNIRKATGEVTRSAKLLPRPPLLVTWQELFRLLERQHGVGQWSADLRAYLARRGLDTFHGIARPRSLLTAAETLRWRPTSERHRWSGWLASGPEQQVQALAAWRASAYPSPPEPWHWQGIQSTLRGGALVLAWR